MLQEVLPSTKAVVKSLQFVTIDVKAIENICEELKEEDFQDLNISLINSFLPLEKRIGLTNVINSVNFSFWPDKDQEKWGVKIGDQEYKGSFGLQKAFEKALEKGIPLTSGEFLANLNLEDLSEILQGNVQIPMLNERLVCLQETGNVLLDKFQGNFANILEEAYNNATNFTNIWVEDFPSFNDYSDLDGERIYFHKRAQLNTKMISDLLEKDTGSALENIDKLTIFADYRIPQTLRNLGILKYWTPLKEKVDGQQEIIAGSKEEVEIRISSIWACEIMKRKLQDKLPNITSCDINAFLWLKSRERSILNYPHHRTRTVAY